MIREDVPNAGIAQLADQLLEVANELLEMTGQTRADISNQTPAAQPFRAEMRRYHANGEFVDLSEIEARILEALLKNRGSLVTKAYLCEILDLDPGRQERNLKSYVYRLRTKLNQLSRPGVTIRPIHGAGYVLSDSNLIESRSYAGIPVA